MDNTSNNQYYRTFPNTNMSQEELYRNYINFINNTTQILNIQSHCYQTNKLHIII